MDLDVKSIDAIEKLPLLPDSRLKTPKNVQIHLGRNWVPIFCASCHKDSGTFVMEENCTFAFYLCDPCAARFGNIDGTYAVPDEVFFERVKQAQLEEFGRELTVPELIEAVSQEDHILSKLAKDRPGGR